MFTYEFLNFAPSARISALGGTHIAVVDEDVNIASANPAVLNQLMHQQLSFSHAFHPAGIGYGYASGHDPTLHFGLGDVDKVEISVSVPLEGKAHTVRREKVATNQSIVIKVP